jgi:hypothetical protein
LESTNVASVSIHIGQLHLTVNSPLIDADFDGLKAFVEWKFLDLPQVDCETPASLPLPRTIDDAVDYNCRKCKKQII